MARLFGDGFDHYGLTESNMLDGEYATCNGGLSLSTFAATGTHSMKIAGGNGLQNFQGLRKVLPTSKDKLGVQVRLWFDSLPSLNYQECVANFLTDDPNRSQVACFVDSNGCIRFDRGRVNGGDSGGTPGTLIAQTDPVITAGAWNHLEIQIYIHDTLGWVRVAVNGTHRYQALNLDTKHNSTNIVSVGQCRPYLSAGGSAHFYMDDYVIYDFTGTPATDTDWCPTYDGSGIATGYIGDLQGILCVPNGNTAEDDFLKSTGSSAFALVDEVDPDDADYIYSATAGDLTELSLTDLPVEITYIRGVDIVGRLSKADAGAAMTKFGMKSVAATTDAAERPITVEPTYWRDQVNVDPNSSARWTRASFNAAWLRLTRSA